MAEGPNYLNFQLGFVCMSSISTPLNCVKWLTTLLAWRVLPLFNTWKSKWKEGQIIWHKVVHKPCDQTDTGPGHWFSHPSRWPPEHRLRVVDLRPACYKPPVINKIIINNKEQKWAAVIIQHQRDYLQVTNCKLVICLPRDSWPKAHRGLWLWILHAISLSHNLRKLMTPLNPIHLETIVKPTPE